MPKKLISVAEYRRQRFHGRKKPSERTIRRWIIQGEIPGRKIGGMYFVDLGGEERQTEMLVKETQVLGRVLTGKALVDRVLIQDLLGPTHARQLLRSLGIPFRQSTKRERSNAPEKGNNRPQGGSNLPRRRNRSEPL